MFRWLDHFTDGIVLSLFDKKNVNIAKGNIELLKFVPIKGAEIAFQDVTDKEGKLVIWTPALQAKDSRKQAILNFQSFNLLKEYHLKIEPPAFII